MPALDGYFLIAKGQRHTKLLQFDLSLKTFNQRNGLCKLFYVIIKKS